MREAFSFTLNDALARSLQGKGLSSWRGLLTAAEAMVFELKKKASPEGTLSHPLRMFSPCTRGLAPAEAEREQRRAIILRDQTEALVCGAAYKVLTQPEEPLSEASVGVAYNLGLNLITIGRMAQNPNKLGEGGVPLSYAQKSYLQMLYLPDDVDLDAAMAAADKVGELPCCRGKQNNQRGLGNFRTLVQYVRLQPDKPF